MTKTKEVKIEAGNEILSHCGKCKEDTTHVISIVEDEKIKKVLCKTCNAQHNYRKPKSLAEDKTKTKPAKKATSRKGQAGAAKKWNDLLANYDVNDAKDYSMGKNFEEASILNHKSFGIGVVIDNIDQIKIHVQFETGIKLLVVNRK